MDKDSLQETLDYINQLKDFSDDGSLPSSKDLLTRTFVLAAGSDEVRSQVQKIISHPNMAMLQLCEILALIALIALRGRYLTQRLSFGRYLWTEVWTIYLGMMVMVILVPFGLFRKEFIDLLMSIGLQFVIAINQTL